MAQTDPARVLAALRKNRLRQEVRKSGIAPAMLQWEQEMFGRTMGAALPRDPRQFLDGTFTPLTPIQPVGINLPDGEGDRPEPRVREMPPGWNMPVGVPGSEGFKLASFQTLRTYADIYSVARACIQTRKNELRGLEWDIMPTESAEKRMRGDASAHREFAERKKIAVRFFLRPDPDYLAMGSYIDAVMEEMLVTDALSLYLHPTQKKGGYGPFGKDVAALEIISGSTIRPLVNSRGGRVRPPSPAYQQYLYGVPRVDLMQILMGSDQDEIKELGKPAKTYRGDQLMYLPYTQRSWTPYGFPPLERTLIPTITGLRKQQFQLDYFDEGTIPGNYISPGENLGWTPNQLQIWQDQNNALAGDPAWKHKSIALPPGSKVFPMRPVPLADQFDEIVMSQVCMGYDVMPMEMGISPKVSTTQSPGAANQMAKATEKTNERKSLKPTLSFLTDIFNVVIQVVWGQEDMRFVFEGLEEDEDENQLVERLVQMLQYGLMSVDECRIALNKPPWGLPITSDPVYVNPTAGMVPLGSIDPLTGKPVVGAAPPAAIGAPPAPGGALPGSPPGGVGGPPKPAGALPAGQPSAAGRPAPGAPAGKPSPGGGPSGTQPGQQAPGGGSPSDPRDALHPDDKVGQARQDTAERHAELQDSLHQDFAAGKPMEPPVRPPISESTEDPDHPDNKAKRPSTKAMISELQAMTRVIKKGGRDPGSWEARHLPPEIIDYHAGLLKHLSPEDAAAVTTDFIVLCFGPSTLVAGLEGMESGVKTFSTAVPLSAQGGAQSLAPYDLAGGSPCTCCDSSPCTCAPGAGCCSCQVGQSDNGATSDLGPNGVTKAVGGSDPKAGRVTRDWPGWRYDLELARIYSARLSEALGAALSPHRVATAWLASQGGPVAPVATKGVLSALAQQAWGWLQSQGFAEPVRAAVQRILTDLWTEGFAVGREAGKEMLDSGYESDFWSRWKPGDPDAARLTAGPGLQKLLQDYGIATIRSVAATRLTQLANVLADGFTKGDSADQIAKDIEPVLKAPQRARMIAITELARSTTQAAVAEYREAGFEGKSWSVTGIPPDNRVCPRCKKNGDQGAIAMAQPFASGDEFTPAHPECRCAILPEEVPADTFGTPGVIKGGDFKAGGLAVRAADTGRVLMIQRAHDEDDPAGGYWEFPGGRLDDGESVEGAARREWAEETGLAVPEGKLVATWDAGNYRGHVLSVPSESSAPILDRDKGANPDDPDNDDPEAIAWWDPAELKDNPAVRPELREHPKRVRRALEATGDEVKKGILADLARSTQVDPKTVFDQLAENYPPESIQWVLRARWGGPYLVSWKLIDHDDMDSWAASHEPDHVKRFERKIEAGKHVNPVVLVLDEGGKEKGHDFIDVDGHHRALAYHNLDRPILAWTGVIDPGDRKAMEETHLDQVHEGASLQNKGIDTRSSTWFTGSMAAPTLKSWRDAWRHELRAPDGRWVRGGANLSTVEDWEPHKQELLDLAREEKRLGPFDHRDDRVLERMAQIQGFDAKPNIGPLDPDRETWHRGFGDRMDTSNGPELADRFSNGDYYGSTGMHGNGAYFTTDHYRASTYGHVMSVQLHPDARVGNSDDLYDETTQLPDDWKEIIGDDAGKMAVLRGVDAFTPPLNSAGKISSSSRIVVNRGALLVEGDRPAQPDAKGVTFRVRSGKTVTDHSSIGDARAMLAHHTSQGRKAKLGYAPGHDARHVSLLASRVRSGEISRADAMTELQHSAALREKLGRHLDGTPGKTPEPKKTPDRASNATLDAFAQFYLDAKDKPGYLNRRTRKELESLKAGIVAELPGAHGERRSRLLGLRGLIDNELGRREPKPKRTPASSGREGLDALDGMADAATFRAYLKGSTDEELQDMMDEVMVRSIELGAGHPGLANLRRLSGSITGEVDRRKTLESKRKAKELAAQQKASAGKAWEGLHAEFGGRGQLESDGTTTAASHLAEFDKFMPDATKRRLAQFGTTLVATVKPVGGSEPDLAKVQPRGYAAGKTWMDSAAAYRPALKRLIMGNTVGHGSTSAALHEGSHALDHALGYPSSNSIEFQSAYYRLPQNKMSPYYTREVNPSGYLSETFAEISAAWLKNRGATASQRRVRMANALGMYNLTGPIVTQMTAIDKYFAKLHKEVENGTR